MKIVILSDSLGRPRPNIKEEERTEYEQVYGYLLRESLGPEHIVDLHISQELDSHEALVQADRVVAFRRPDIAIFHFGINDCAPRLFKKGGRALVLRPWFRRATGDFFLKKMGRYRRHITRLRPLTHATPEQFEANMRGIVAKVREYSPDARLLMVSIAEAPDWLAKRSTGINENVHRYNAILKDVFGDGYVDLGALIDPESGLISDGIHLTAQSHRILAEELLRRVLGSSEGSEAGQPVLEASGEAAV